MRALHWFRNDLRLEDNTALSASADADELIPVFVFDPRLYGETRAAEPRLRFLADCVERLSSDLARRGCPLVARVGDPKIEIPRLLSQTRADLLTFNRDYTPYARRRDEQVSAAALKLGVNVRDCKDRVVFESDEVRTQGGTPFRVYTPYRRTWLRKLADDLPAPGRIPRLPKPVAGVMAGAIPTPEELGTAADHTRIPTGGEKAAHRRLNGFLDSAIAGYAQGRDLPAVDGTSRLSPHLRFGTISVRSCLQALDEAVRDDRRRRNGAGRWRDELIWREFYQALLAEYPDVLRHAFREEYREIPWNDDDTGFAAWCEGRTGYPFVDAAMRQLVQTGWMHNRARMVVASFLVKDLLIDWRRGERFFMQRLVDGDPASNNGGWQWAASTGTDAQPYFRIFNPVAQGEKFDPDGSYVRRFVPELCDVPDRFVHRPWQAPHPPADYPPPIVDHAERRIAAIARFAAAKQRSG